MNFMFLLAAGASSPGVYYAYQHSDNVGKGIVIFLLVGSVITWTVMVTKVISIYWAKLHSERFLYMFQNNRGHVTAPSLVREGSDNPGPLAAVYSAGVEKLLEFYEEGQDTNIITTGSGVLKPVKLSDAQYNAIEAVLESEVSSQIEQLETRIGLLATLVSLSPFCGLFGTVWGVMMAFCGIAAAGKADFTALAPGVAGALLTTVAGLVVAIPSLVGYNVLTAMIRNLTVQMDNFTEAFMVKIKLEQLEFDRNDRERRRVPGSRPDQPEFVSDGMGD